MEKLIEILTWLDESNVAYLLMIAFFIGMYKLHEPSTACRDTS